jgi:SAM-dependent methyltransferase
LEQVPGTFTAHNILLDDGRQTKPEEGWSLADTPLCTSAIRILRAVFPNGLNGLRIADLACLEGGYAVEFARHGMDALGIEVRSSNYKNCLLVKRGLSLENLNFVQDNVWNLERYGEFDAIYCCGLLYHLDRPREFLTLLSKMCRKLLILNTHFSTNEPDDIHSLSELCENEGLPGRWYVEFSEGFKGDKDADYKWSSWDNARSFWLTKQALFFSIYTAGFPVVMEQVDWMETDVIESMTSGFYRSQSRGIFIGIKP